MRNNIKKSFTMMLMAAVFTLLLGMSVFAKTYKENVGAPINLDKTYFIYYGPASGISKVKSSNKKVAVVITEKEGSDVNVYLKLKKTGTTNVSYSIKTGERKGTHKVKLNVYRYKNPFKVLKVGDMDYRSQFNGEGDYSTLMEGKGKVQVKVKKGWQVKSIYAKAVGDSKWRKLKKGAEVDIAHKHCLQIVLKNKKYGFEKAYWIWGAID